MKNKDVVDLGKIVTIVFEGSKKPLQISINSGMYQDKVGVMHISSQAPLAKAIINHKTGERIEFESPEGRLMVKIINVTRGS